jgi:hypothetical protein
MTVRNQTETRPLLGLVAIVAIGFGLRAINIGDQPLWGDEALTLMIAQWPVATLFLTPNDPSPGLYYVLHKFLIGPEAGVVAARSISLIAGTAAIVAVFGWAKACRIPALSAAALTALCFVLVDYSQEARAYSLLVLLVSLSGWAFVRWSVGRKPVALISFGTCLLLSLYTHFASVFWIAPMIIAAFLVVRDDRLDRRKLEWMLCALVVLAIPEANRLIRYPTANFSWLGQPGPIEALNVSSYVLLPFGFFENEYWRLGKILCAVAGSLCFMLIGVLAYKHKAKLAAWADQNRAATLSLLVCNLVPLEIWIFGYFKQPILMPRTMLFSAPGFFILVSLILSFEGKLAQRAVLAAYALNLLLTGTVREKEDWRSANELLASNVKNGDVILLCPGWKAFAFRHAMDRPLDVPLLLEINGQSIQVEQRLGRDPHWVSAYYVALTKRQGFQEGQRSLTGAKRTWRVSSGCLTD